MQDKNHPTGPMEQTKANVAAEVHEYLQNVRDRNPEELLGVDAQSGLIRATIQATIVSVLVMAACTVIPYWRSQAAPAGKPAEQAHEADQAAPGATAKDAPAKSDPVKPAVAPGATEPAKTADTTKPPVSKEAINKLGVNDTKTTSPKVNPLEKSVDDLFKDLDKK